MFIIFLAFKFFLTDNANLVNNTYNKKRKKEI